MESRGEPSDRLQLKMAVKELKEGCAVVRGSSTWHSERKVSKKKSGLRSDLSSGWSFVRPSTVLGTQVLTPNINLPTLGKVFQSASLLVFVLSDRHDSIKTFFFQTVGTL